MAIGVNPSWSTSSTNLLQHLDTPAGTALFTLTAGLTARHSDRKGLSCYETRNLLSKQSGIRLDTWIHPAAKPQEKQ